MSEEKDQPVEPDTPETNATPEQPAETGHGAPVDPDKPVNPDFQDNDIQLETVRRFIFGSLGVTLVFFVLMLIVHRLLLGSQVKERGVATRETRVIPTEDQPLLQTDELMDLQEYKAQQQARLNTTTNVGEHAVVPIEDMMRRMVAQGAFPVATPAPEGAARPAPQPTPAPVAPAPVETASAPAEAPRETLDPEMVAAGQKIWERHCVVCHSGQANAIGPNIRNAFGTMRELENADPILMDDWYVRNSLNNPNEHIAKGYAGVMMSFKNVLTNKEKDQVIAFLKSEGPNPPPMRGEEPEPAPAPAAPAPMIQPAPTPVPAVPTPAPAPVPAPVEPAPIPAPAPEPTPAPRAPIFI